MDLRKTLVSIGVFLVLTLYLVLAQGGMNTLPMHKRVQILNMLVEGMSMRAASRVADVSINTVKKLLIQAGQAAAAYHDAHVRNVPAKRVQCDEIWSFVYAKQKTVERMGAAPKGAGDVWTWTAIDADSKLIVSYLVGGRDGGYAFTFMQDVAARLAKRVQLTTDGHRAYLEAVEDAFGPAECIGARPSRAPFLYDRAVFPALQLLPDS